MSSLDENILHGCCVKLQDAQKHNDKFDIDVDDLFLELQVLHMCVSPEIKSTIEVLKFVKTPNCFSNVSIAYRILFTMSVNVWGTLSLHGFFP